MNIQITIDDKHVGILCEPNNVTNTELKSALLRVLEVL